MELIIFGAGHAGRDALQIFGSDIVGCFADNDNSKQKFCGKQVISFAELQEKYEQAVIIIASYDYAEDIAKQFDEAGMRWYSLFTRETYAHFPYFVQNVWHSLSYEEVLADFHLEQKGSLCLYGERDIPLLYAYLLHMRLADKVVAISRADEHNCQGERKHCFDRMLTDVGTALKQTDTVIVSVPRSRDNNYEILDDADRDKLVYLADYEQFIHIFQHPELKKFCDKHKGERCFLIGNGPSLQADDLNTLHKHNEITFAFNKIYKIFPETNWRPTYYAISDSDVYGINIDEVMKLHLPAMFFSDGALQNWYISGTERRVPGAYYFHEQLEKLNFKPPRFSHDFSKMTFGGVTCTYDVGFQLALYMGFSQIYLLGIDNSSPGKSLFGQGMHFYRNNMTKKEEKFYGNIRDTIGTLDDAFINAEIAYRMAKKELKKRHVSVYNATRGGALEVFERVDFDALFD